MANNYKPKTNEELKAIAKGIYSHQIFTDRHVKGTEIHMVFMPLLFMSKEQIDQLQENKIGLIFEYIEKASPRSCNGMPSFFSMQLLDETDCDKMFGLLRQFEACEEMIQVPT